NKLGTEVPTIQDANYFKTAFDTVQQLINDNQIEAGHDIGSGGLITTLLEMTFADVNLAANYDLSGLNESDSVKVLFSENIGLVLQAKDDAVFEQAVTEAGVDAIKIGHAIAGTTVTIKNGEENFSFDVAATRD